MSIIITKDHKETAEVEFAGRHPDIFSSYVSAEIVKRLAEHCDEIGKIRDFRADINVQCLATSYQKGRVTPIKVNVGGQIVIPQSINFKEIVRQSVIFVLSKAKYLDYQDFSTEHLCVDISGVTVQSPNLNSTTKENKFADSCVVYGHYLSSGINGTFPSLVIAQQIDLALRNLKIPGLRSDGKVHVSVRYTSEGFIVEDIYLSVAHSGDIALDFREKIRKGILKQVKGLEVAIWHINEGGDFNVYFLQADSGVSKAKDDVIITGGIHQLGTDRVWGKCLYKASSTLIPYVFTLSKIICNVTGARFACVSGYSQYGQREAEFQLQDIDPNFEHHREQINKVLREVPKDRNSIRRIMNLEVNLHSYRVFNDIQGFHYNCKPWKDLNVEFDALFKEKFLSLKEIGNFSEKKMEVKIKCL